MTSFQVYLRLLGYLKPFAGAGLLVLLGFAINAGTEVAVAKLMQYIIDAINHKNQNAKNLFPVLVVVMFALRGLGSFLGNYYIAYISRHLVYMLRKEIFAKIMNLPVSYYLTHSSGRLSAKIIHNVGQVTAAATDALKTIIREGLIVICLLSYLFYTNWRLSLCLFAVTPFVVLIVRKASSKMKRLSTDMQNTMGEVSHITNESIDGYQVVKSYSGQAFEEKRFDDASLDNLNKGMKMVVTSSINTPLVQLIMASAMAVVVWLALRPQILGTTSAGEFIAYITAAGLLSKPVRALTEVNTTLQSGIAAAQSVFEVLDIPQEKDDGTRTDRLTGAIEFQHVGFHYPDGKRALSDFNLTVKAGQTIALVGRSGAGKTTLVNLLMRFQEKTSGQILLDGIPIDELTLETLRTQVSSVGQQVVLFDQTIHDNIAYGQLANKTDADVLHASKQAYADDFIRHLPEQYQTKIGPNGLSLSGGQRQRLAIARALLKDAPILILDEATSALDNESEYFIQQALTTASEGRTTIVIAHRLSTIESADVIVVMDQGRIVEQGSHADLLAKEGLYAQLHSRHFEE